MRFKWPARAAGLLVLAVFLTQPWSAAPFAPAIVPAAAQTVAPGTASKEQRLADFIARSAPNSGAGTPAAQPVGSSSLYRVLNMRSAAQECGNYCGPAATYEALTYSGLQTSQRQAATWLGTPGCSINAAGT